MNELLYGDGGDDPGLTDAAHPGQSTRPSLRIVRVADGQGIGFGEPS